MADFRSVLQRLREELDRLKQAMQDLINKGDLSAQDIDVSSFALTFQRASLQCALGSR